MDACSILGDAFTSISTKSTGLYAIYINASIMVIGKRLAKQHNMDMLVQAIIYLSLHLRAGERIHGGLI